MKIRNINNLVTEIIEDLLLVADIKDVENSGFESKLRERLLISYPGSVSPEMINASVLIGDIRGFTSLSDKYEAAQLFDILNLYFSRIIDVLEKYNGMIDKFIGDAVMAIFPADSPEQVMSTLRCAVEIQLEMEKLNNDQKAKGVDTLHMGIGINTGRVIAGCIGSDKYREYTVIGSEVNLASRVESFSMRGQVLLSESTHTINQKNISIGSVYDVQPKGKNKKIQIFELTGITFPDFIELPRKTRRKFIRAAVNLNLKYNLVEGKYLGDKLFDARAVDISYTGIGLHTQGKLAEFTEIRILLSMSLLGADVNEIYAKVVRCTEDNGYYIVGLEFTSIDDKALDAIKVFVDSTLSKHSDL